MQVDRDTVIAAYEYFYHRVLRRKGFSFDPSKREYDMINKFISMMYESYKSSMSVEVLFEYMLFQFYRWKDAKTTFSAGTVFINWVFGKKSVKLWLELTKEVMMFDKSLDDANKKYGINIVSFYNSVGQDDRVQLTSPVDVRRIHDMERKRFYNTEKGLAICLLYTSMYDKDSSLCMECFNMADCISFKKYINAKVA